MASNAKRPKGSSNTSASRASHKAAMNALSTRHQCHSDNCPCPNEFIKQGELQPVKVDGRMRFFHKGCFRF